MAIIGAGIMGLSTALHLARAGREVAILERGQPWREASGVNAGSFSPQILSPAIIPHALEAIRLWKDLAAEVGGDVGFVPCGGLRVATSAEEARCLRASASRSRGAGMETEWLEGSALRDRAPWLGPGVGAATFCAEEGFGNPLLAGREIAAAVVKAGAMLIPRTEVCGMTAHARGFHLETPRGPLRCGALVIASGAWSGDVARLLSVELPVQLRVNMLSVTESCAPVMDRLVTHARRNLTLKQLPPGTCLIGGGWQGRGDLGSGRKELDYALLAQNYRLAASVVPALGHLHVTRMWVGFEGATPDELPLLGRLPGRPGAFIIACARAGYTLGPALGRLMAELVLTGQTSMPVGAFTPQRFIR